MRIDVQSGGQSPCPHTNKLTSLSFTRHSLPASKTLGSIYLRKGKRLHKMQGSNLKILFLVGSYHVVLPVRACLPIPVTHAGTHQDFYVRDFRPKPYGMNQRIQVADPRFAANPFHRQQMHGFHQPPGFGHPHFDQAMLPSMVFLFTSLASSHQPYWSSSPVCAMQGSEPPPLDRQFTHKIG